MKGNLILQDIILNKARRDKLIITIKISTGEELKGKIRGFDNFTLILDTIDNRQIMVYKHNLVCINLDEPILIDQ